ncbi:hypothetical protein SpCBS45565_g07018 [Spizellomyces sp. 'palustris']|nr:hypothetical protein SpCBS45565_g07018 [Spizellomyces sp. 'palustris']
MSRVHRPKSAENELLKVLSSTSVGSIGNYTFGRTLGEGTFGKVKLAKHNLTGQQVAIKIVDKIHAPTVVREIETWRHMHHSNIARLYEVLCSETRIFMVMEYCTGGEAFDYVCAHGRFDDRCQDAKRVFRQIAEAVGYCHEKNFVHRDLKLENILLTENLDVKLIDFGFTREVTTRNLLDTYCGSVAYAAPGKQYSGPQADIWSLGVILYTLLCGYLPFDDDSEAHIRRKILELDYDLPDFLGELTKDLIQSMLKLEGSDRISIKEMLAHPWFKEADTAAEEEVRTLPPSPALVVDMADETTLMRNLRLAGLDVDAIMTSVKSNACDQASALWYLLLDKHRSVNAGYPRSPLSPGAESPLSPVVVGDMNGGDYLAQARRKTLGEAGHSFGEQRNSSSRRALVTDLKSTSSVDRGGGKFGRGRRRWEGKGGDNYRQGPRRGLGPSVSFGHAPLGSGRGWITEESEPEEGHGEETQTTNRTGNDKALCEPPSSDSDNVEQTHITERWADCVAYPHRDIAISEAQEEET